MGRNGSHGTGRYSALTNGNESSIRQSFWWRWGRRSLIISLFLLLLLVFFLTLPNPSTNPPTIPVIKVSEKTKSPSSGSNKEYESSSVNSIVQKEDKDIENQTGKKESSEDSIQPKDVHEGERLNVSKLVEIADKGSYPLPLANAGKWHVVLYGRYFTEGRGRKLT